MKIALIGTTLFHQGAEFVLATLARGLAERGHDVTVVLSKYQDDWQKAHPNWKPFEVGHDVCVVIQPKRRARESVLSLRHILKGGGYDVVMCHSKQYTYSLVFALFAMRNRPMLIHVEHSSGVGTTEDGRIVGPRISLLSFLKNTIRNRVDAQFTVSDGTADAISRMTGYPRSRIYTVYNPVIDTVYKNKLTQGACHPWLKNKSLPVIVAAGAFCSFKNHHLLFQAFANVIQRLPARLILFGEGGLRNEYEQIIQRLGISEFVSLPGFTDNLPAELKQADCFVVSSKIESFSVVLVEALAAGVPVVSTNCPYGPPEILKNGKYGLLVENGNAVALSDGIFEVLSGHGVIAPPEAVEPYTIDATVTRYESCLSEVMRGRLEQRCACRKDRS